MTARATGAAKAGTTRRKAATTRKTTAKTATAPQRSGVVLPHPDLPSREETLGIKAAQAQATGEKPGPLNGVPFEPVRLTTKTDEDAEPEIRLDLFSIDDTMYTIPARPSMSISLQFMHLAGITDASQVTARDAVAVDYLLGELLSEDGWKALREFKQLEPDQFKMITEIATTVAMGALELPKGPGSA
jgi:hypothetical protein